MGGGNSRKILILGLDGAGKTTLLNYITNQRDNQNILPTLGYNERQHFFSTFKTQIFDLGGSQEFRQFWTSYGQKTNLVIFVVDSFDTRRFEEAALQLQIVADSQYLSGCKYLIFCNKQDLPGALKPDEVAGRIGLSVLSNYEIFGCAAATGQGLADVGKVIADALE